MLVPLSHCDKAEKQAVLSNNFFHIFLGELPTWHSHVMECNDGGEGVGVDLMSEHVLQAAIVL